MVSAGYTAWGYECRRGNVRGVFMSGRAALLDSRDIKFGVSEVSEVDYLR